MPSKGLRVALIATLACALALSLVYEYRLLQAVVWHWVVESPDARLATVIPLLAPAIPATGVFFLIARMLLEAVKGRSPFSVAQARRLFVISPLLVASALLEALAYAGFPDAVLDAMGLFADGFAQTAHMHTEVLLIVAAIVSFGLSRLIKYGSFLQCFYDETV